jgi:hypothetical protein
VSVRTGMCAVGQGEQRGSTPRVYAFAFVQTSAAWPRGDTKLTACAWRRNRDKSTTNRFKRGGVQGRGGQKGSNLGSLARRTHVRRCVGVRGGGTAECRAQSQTGEAGARPLGCVCSCACRTPTARPWQRHKIDGVHKAREQRKGDGEERPGGIGWGHTPANDLACA